MFGAVTAAQARRQNGAVINDASGHMHPMKAGEDEKSGRKKMRSKRKAEFRQPLGDQMGPLVSLASQKEQAA